MNKIKLFAIATLILPSLVLAQAGTPVRAGLTPEDTFYFVDKLGEALREFFTFSSEGKARLQISFASERIAEIKIVLEEKGVEAGGLTVAQNRLQEHLGSAAAIIEDEKKKGKDVSFLAKELDDDIDEQKDVLKSAFKEKKRVLKEKENGLKLKIKEARQIKDAALLETLLGELTAVKAEREQLEAKEDEQEEILEKEKEKIEKEIEEKAEAEKEIKEAEEEKKEVLTEAAEEGVTLPAGAFDKFDRLLAQAKELFERGNYQGAKQLAKQAEKSLKEAEDDIKKLEEELEELDDELENFDELDLDGIEDEQDEASGKNQNDQENKKDRRE